MSNEILTEIKLDLDGLRADLAESKKHSEETAAAMGERIGSKIEEGFKKPFEGLKEKFLEIGSVIAAAFTMEKAIEAAKEGENALQSLNSAMAITGTYTTEASQHFVEYSEALEKTTSSSHVAIQTGGALLVTLGKLRGEGLDRATKASLDLAAALHVDTATAFKLVAKAATGHTAALGRYGITVRQTGDAHRDFSKALEMMETRFKGLAEMQTNTFDGAMKRTKNMFDNLLESIGNIVIKSPIMLAMFKALAGAFEEASKAIAKWAANRDIIAEMSTALITFGHNLTTYVVAPLEFAYNVGKIVFEGFKTLVQGAITAIADAAQFVTGVLARLSPRFKEADDAMKTFALSSNDTLKSFVKDTSQAMDKVFDFSVAEKADAYLAKVQTFVNHVKPIVKTKFKELSDAAKPEMPPGFFSSFVEGWAKAAKDTGKLAAQLGGQVHNTIGVGVTNSFAAMGAAMVKGEDGMKAFGNAMLGVLGDIAIQFGTTFMMMGIAKSLMFDPTGPLLVAAGAALAVLGGALKGIAGGGGASAGAASASGGGGVASSGGSGSAPADVPQQNFNGAQRNANTGTAVAVNVQGNILDNRQTGLHLAEILNDTFANNGTVLATSGHA